MARILVLAQVVLLLLATAGVSFSANIIDLLYWDTLGRHGTEKSVDSDIKSTQERSCSCVGPACMCCINFNISFIDLGGPGCVQTKYISQGEGLLVNVSYGDSLLHSEQVRSGPNPKPTCMSLLANLAEVCARFISLEAYNDGLKGCLQLEPRLLGDIETELRIGCFIMSPEGMKIDDTAVFPSTSEANTPPPVDSSETSESNSSQNETENINEEEILAVVSESAQQGLAFFGNLLGISIGGEEPQKQASANVTSESEGTESRSKNSPNSLNA